MKGRYAAYVCERWRSNYRNFEADVGLRPSPRHRLDRMDSTGTYEPGNVRWITPIQQSLRQGVRSNSGTGVAGVYWDNKFQRFHATITMNRRRHHLGRYKTLPEAAKARFLAEARYTV